MLTSANMSLFRVCEMCVSSECVRCVLVLLCLIEAQASPDVLKALAKELNELKSRFLQDLKKDLPPFPEEKLLAFEHRTRQMLSEHMRNTRGTHEEHH